MFQISWYTGLKKYDQGVHENYHIGYTIPINSNKFTDFVLKKVKILTWKIKKPKKPKISTFQFFLKNLKNLGFLKWVWTALVIGGSVVTRALRVLFSHGHCVEIVVKVTHSQIQIHWRCKCNKCDNSSNKSNEDNKNSRSNNENDDDDDDNNNNYYLH